MKKFVFLALLLSVCVLFAGCTENIQTRYFGAESQIILPENCKLVNATWKASNLWLLTRPMKVGDAVESYTFIESSNFGVFEGKIFITETKVKINK